MCSSYYEPNHGRKEAKFFPLISACVFTVERLLKMSLEELREFLQERIAQTFFYSDDVIVEQLQVSMTELRKMKLDLPPPGTRLHTHS